MRAILALCLALFLGACGSPKLAPVASGATVLALGDSITLGVGAGEGEDYPSLLAARTGWKIVNAGVSGETSADGLARTSGALDANAPQLVLVEFGGNDFLRGVPRAQTAANLKNILAECRKRGIPAILIAVPQPSVAGAVIGHLSDDPLYSEVAKDTGTPLIEDVLAKVLSKTSLKSDQIHPNAAGYRAMAEGLVARLQELGIQGKR